MAVFTPLNETIIKELLAKYDVGTLKAWHGIEEGVENSNFFLHTTQGRYILTLFEKRTKGSDLPYFIDYMSFIGLRGIKSPIPLPDRMTNIVHMVKGKPAILFTFLEGQGAKEIRAEHMPLLGNLVAKMHKAAEGFKGHRANALALPGWKDLVDRIRHGVENPTTALPWVIDDEMQHLEMAWPRALPSGAVHADLFPDNVFFQRGEDGQLRVSGVIDFYFACTEYYMYDLAICLNAWCFDSSGQYRADFARAMFDAYQSVRPFEPEEKRAMLTLARGAAVRFLLTRTYDTVFHPPGAMVKPKDPAEYRNKLMFFRSLHDVSGLGLE